MNHTDMYVDYTMGLNICYQREYWLKQGTLGLCWYIILFSKVTKHTTVYMP